MIKHSIVILALMSSALLAGCAKEEDKYDVTEYDSTTNPASLYCVQQGGDLVMVTEGQKRVTYCKTSQDEQIEQWEYYENRDKSKDKQ